MKRTFTAWTLWLVMPPAPPHVTFVALPDPPRVFLPSLVSHDAMQDASHLRKIDVTVVRIGKGGDKDELNTVYIYDSHMFPFHRAEQYHQFYKVPPCPLHVSLALAHGITSSLFSASLFLFLFPHAGWP